MEELLLLLLRLLLFCGPPSPLPSINLSSIAPYCLLSLLSE